MQHSSVFFLFLKLSHGPYPGFQTEGFCTKFCCFSSTITMDETFELHSSILFERQDAS
jgi:hypothetical protein